MKIMILIIAVLGLAGCASLATGLNQVGNSLQSQPDTRVNCLTTYTDYTSYTTCN